ncbi:MAG: HTTM domain-containing protein [Deltaproteobacteria bacterium]|nr:HTTM domain-containing protein [Deltaproteobacteria bacterium]
MGKRKKKKPKLRSSKGSSSIPKDESSSGTKLTSNDSAKATGTSKGKGGSRERLESGFDRYFFGQVAAVRPYLLLRLTLLLLAFDCWVDLIPHAGRYGVGDFNVAHFGILELLPTPTPGLYIGTLVLTGWLSLVMAVRPARVGLAVLFGLYTYGWSMSMLDSYQHHYLISLLLFSFMFFPVPAATEVFGPTGTGEETSEKDLRRGRVIGGFLLLVFVADATMAACGVRSPLDRLLGEGTLVIGLRATAILLGALLILMVDEGPKSEGKPTSAWAYVSFCVTCAIVYFYTAITKLAPDWREGHALRRLGNSDAFQELQAQAIGPEGLPVIGTMEVDSFWKLMATGAILVQLVGATGYLLAAKQERFGGWKRYLIAALGLAPLSFHVGAERMELEIGWFSYYMLLVLFVVFLPVEILRPVGAAFSWPARFLRERLGDAPRGAPWLFLGVGLVSSLAVAMSLDLPGTSVAGGLLSAMLVVGVVVAERKGRLSDARGWGIGAIVAGGAMLVSITLLNDVRYDYYRFVGGDHRRRGELVEALEAYEKANEYQLYPWCLSKGRERGECFRTEETARARAAELGDGWTAARSDRKEKEDEVRERLERQRAAEGDE